ncbi:hypothetical protein KKA94_01465, partial [Patescibacteria group bacterium]|nr:hypothetical protein [Patescibacteria group bacterium]
MVKLVLAAILVNFSKLISGIIIDGAHVFTVTFVNAISAVAGGNLISMFKLDQMRQMIQPSGTPSAVDNIDIEILAGAFFALLFSAIAMFTIGAYAIIMLIRMVALWVLIILSPLAYIFAVIPQTKQYSDRWWKEFSSNVIVAPIMVFFMWLAFATMGSGEIENQLPQDSSDASPNYDALSDSTSVTLNAASTWESMSTILIAVAFLLVGAKVASESGAAGAGLATKGVDLGKKVTGKIGKFATLGIGGFVGKRIPGVQAAKQFAQMAYYKAKLAGRELSVVGGKGVRERAGAIEQMKSTLEAQERRDKAKGKAKWGNKSAAKMALQAETAERSATGVLDKEKANQKAAQLKVEQDIVFNLADSKFSDAQKKNPSMTPEEEEKARLEAFRGALKEAKTPLMRSYQDEADKRAAMSKAEKEEGYALGTARDIGARELNKPAIYLRREQMKRHKEKMEDWAGLSYDERFYQLDENVERVRRLKDKQDGGEVLSDDEQSALTASMKNATLITTSIFENGDGNDLQGHLDDSWGDTKIDSSNVHQAILSLTTGKKMNELDTPENAIKAEQDLKKALGGSAEMYFRNLGGAVNADAAKNGNYHLAGQVITGLNDKGELETGFANNMSRAKDEEGPAIATGELRTTRSGKNGKQIQQGKEKYGRARKSFHQYEDGRGIIAVDKDGKAQDVLSDDARGQLEDIVTASESEISRMSSTLANLLSGGDAENSGYNSAQNEFKVSDKMGPIITGIVDKMKARIGELGITGTEKNRRENALVKLMNKMSGGVISNIQEASNADFITP